MNNLKADGHKSGLRQKTIWLAPIVVIAFAIGFFIGSGGQQENSESLPSEKKQDSSTDVSKANTVWTCSMHPQIKLPKEGKCPICFMDLIPLESDSEEDESPLRYSMSEKAKTLAQIRTTEVKRDKAEVKRRLVGMVFENETKVAALTSRISGRLDEVFIDFVGAKVEKGDPMVTIWSPTLITSQVELFETLKSSEYDKTVAKGAEEKLIQYGLTKEQIEEIKKKNTPDLSVTLRAPISGVVMEKNALLGNFVDEGTEMFIITDLSTVWVKLDAYESDLPWIKYGQKVTFTTPAVPGKEFHGKVLFIDPMLQMETRSVKVRVEAENPDLLLKPHMLATAVIHASIDSQGRVINPEWAGKAVCPVHPDVTGKPGDICPTSKKDLAPPTAFGYATNSEPELPLVIPSTAVLFTGERSVVYVEVPDTDKPTYELRDISIGPRAGDKYVVLDGLEEGERVVTYGNFKIDSAMQILAKPSMMNPERPTKKEAEEKEEEIIERVQVSKDFLDDLSPVIIDYLKLKEALVEEKPDSAAQSASAMLGFLKKVKPEALTGDAKSTWDELSGQIIAPLESMADTSDIGAQRRLFDPLSENFARLVLSFRHTMEHPLFLFFCPMAFDNRGAYWLEPNEDLRNPYFGHEMLKCGELVETIPSENGVSGSGKNEGNENSSEDSSYHIDQSHLSLAKLPRAVHQPLRFSKTGKE